MFGNLWTVLHEVLIAPKAAVPAQEEAPSSASKKGQDEYGIPADDPVEKAISRLKGMEVLPDSSAHMLHQMGGPDSPHLAGQEVGPAVGGERPGEEGGVGKPGSGAAAGGVGEEGGEEEDDGDGEWFADDEEGGEGEWEPEVVDLNELMDGLDEEGGEEISKAKYRRRSLEIMKKRADVAGGGNGEAPRKPASLKAHRRRSLEEVAARPSKSAATRDGDADGQSLELDERDVSMHQEYRQELKGLMRGQAAVPRLFMRGRYVGGTDEVVALNESGVLARLAEDLPRVQGRGKDCAGCGSHRFVPCSRCNGSRKMMKGSKAVRCTECNENGLVRCPRCS
eukprot:jgi/Mesen1/6511/ME000332S05519